MLRTALRRALATPRPLARTPATTTTTTTRSLSALSSSPLRSLHRPLPTRLPALTRAYASTAPPLAHPLRPWDSHIMTISDPNYKPDAPYAFVTQPGNALDHLPRSYEVAQTAEGQPRYAVFTGEIERSPNDDREYRTILLENGMEAILISDPTADKAAAAMDVKVGHLSDPEDIPGLAHFCEHLMFMGTEKYPAENDYTEFLTQHSGSSNAFTGMDQTCYYFDVSPTALDPALDRFAQFFISPLFDPSCTEREANAVHSENSKNLQSDMWRFFQLDKSLSSREHAFWRFGTGTRETLWDEPNARGEDVRKRLIEWCEKHYSANVCKLAVVGKDSLDALTDVVVKHFSPVPNRHLTPPTFPGNPLKEEQLGRTVFIKSVRDQRMIEFTFPFPEEAPYYASKSSSFLSHLIGHEGTGSVLSYLKEKGWANGMSAGAGGNGAAGFEFFKVQVDLTQEGLDNYETVASSLFAYVSLLRAQPPPEWSFNEVASLSQLAFRFKEKSPPTNTVSNLSILMSKPWPREKVLSAPWVCSEFFPAKVDELLGLLRPENCRIFLSAQKEIEGRTYEGREKWYGTEYTVEKMSDKILSSASPTAHTLFPSLSLPARNALVPSNLSIKPPTKADLPEGYKPATKPKPVLNEPTLRVWHKKDDRWWVPRAGVFFLIRSPFIDHTALSSIQSRLFTELIRDSLQEEAYDAELAGLSYTFDQSGDCIILSVDGYDDKMPLLVEKIARRMREYRVDEKRFEIIREQLRRAYTNFRLEQPYQHAGFDGSHLFQALSYTFEDKLVALSQVTPSNLEAHVREMLGRMHVEVLVHGNFTEDEALEVARGFEGTFQPQALSEEELKSHVALIPPVGQSLARRVLENPDETNNGVEQVSYLGNIYDDRLRAEASLFGTLIQEPFFDDLRGKQQLGYIVQSGGRKSISFLAVRTIVQSEHSAAHVEQRIDQFWVDFRAKLELMPEEEFEKYKKTVVSRKLEDHKNMWQESSALWMQIGCWWYDFEQDLRDAETIKTLTKPDLLTFMDRYLSSSSPELRRLSVHVTSQRLSPDQLGALAPTLATFDLPLDAETLKTQLGAFAATRPTVAAAKTFAAQFLRDNGRTEEQVRQIEEEIERLGQPEAVPEGVELIEDREKWRAERERAPPAHPVEEFAHLVPPALRKPAKL
ncbi:hypothetical protein JCM8097_005898 [Rhodosporidiobolus ruineniae]